MPFRILTEEEIQFLTEEELAVYNEELELRKEREKLVENLEKYENVRLKEYVPVLNNIDAVSVAVERNIAIPALGKISLKEGYVLNEADYSDKFKPIDIPQINVSKNNFSLTDTEVYEKLEKLSISFDEPSVMPKMNAVTVADAPDVKMPAKVSCKPENMPDIMAHSVRNISFDAPDMTVPALFTDFGTDAETRHFTGISHELSGIDDISLNISAPSYSFEMPEMKKASVNTVEVTMPHTAAKFETAELSLSDMPEVEINADLRSMNFSAPEFSPELPDIGTIPNVRARTFSQAECAPADIPDIKVNSANVRNITEIKNSAPVVPDIDIAVSRNFTGNFDMPLAGRVSLNTDVSTVSVRKINIPCANVSGIADIIISRPER